MLLISDLDDTLYDRSRFLPDNYALDDLKKIRLFPGVIKFFQQFPGIKILVTRETDLGLQSLKIKKLGIEKLFDHIYICHSDEGKKSCFEEIRRKYPREEIWSIGDRVDLEIRYGKELGFKTVRIKQGKYKDMVPRQRLEEPDYEITQFRELSALLKAGH